MTSCVVPIGGPMSALEEGSANDAGVTETYEDAPLPPSNGPILRFLCPRDVAEVKKLCAEWFPVEYPDSWYKDITSDSRFYSLAAVVENKIVGLIVAEVKTRIRCHREDFNILSATFPSSTQVAYILSLGVVQEHRRKGIATSLLQSLISYLTSSERANVKAVYLHVLASNTTAIRFYEKHNFRRHEYLPYYYAIKGQPKDGLSYVLYVNGGQPPWTLIDYMKHMGSYISRIQPCTLPQAMARHTRNLFAGRRNWLPSVSLPNVNVNMNILSRIRGQSSSEGSGDEEDPEQRDDEHEHDDIGASSNSVAIPCRDDAESWDTVSEVYCTGRPRNWLPSMPSMNLNLLARFRGHQGSENGNGDNSREPSNGTTIYSNGTTSYKDGGCIPTISEQEDDHTL
ncbi:N-alpha-acetyltransferase 60-like [Amphiura filiformis]|uniref:N-alpha-acetyltransferase 60-like n=1 Tax=Amphiura filiformis TaxID=82378 RepID=UPI003B21AF84